MALVCGAVNQLRDKTITKEKIVQNKSLKLSGKRNPLKILINLNDFYMGIQFRGTAFMERAFYTPF